VINERELPDLIRSQIIERQRLGRGWVHWVEAESLLGTARDLRDSGWSVLEAVTAFEVVQERAMVLTYFLSQPQGASFWIRISLQRDPKRPTVSATSVRTIWPAAEAMENGLERTMSIRFRKTGN
jgi:hypothetical protein